MTAALWLGLGAAVAVAANALAWAYPRQVRRRCSLRPSALRQLRSLAPSRRAAALVELGASQGWVRELGEELWGCRSDGERVATINESLRLLDHQLSRGAHWPTAGGWLTAAGTLLCLVAGFLAGSRTELLGLIPVGLAGVTGCLSAGRAGRRSARQQRARIDEMVSLVAGELYDREVAMPIRRRRRGR